MLANLPVGRSPAARTLFVMSAAVTAAILLWAHRLLLSGSLDGLSPIFFDLFAALDYPASMAALVILLGAIFVPARAPLRPLLRWIGTHPGWLAAGSVAVLSLGTLLVYRDHPLAMDEYVQLFQSQVFAAGHLAGQFPPALLDWLVPRGFQNYFLSVSHATGRVASEYWPSFALILTPFTWLGVPWLCNPIISAATLVTLHRLAMRLFGDVESAGLVLLFTVASPVFFANGISYYSMPAHLLLNCVYALLLLEPTARRAAAAGVVGSIALTLHNPVPHTLFALPWLIWVVRRPGGVRLFLWLSLGYLPLCLLLGVGWFWFYGHLAHEGTLAAAGTSTADVGRLASAFRLPNSTVLLARLIGIAKIWVWAVPGLILLAGIGAWKWRDDGRIRLLVLSAVLTLVGYTFVPVDQGHGWGYRYFHSVWLALPILGAAALTPRSTQEQRPQATHSPESNEVLAFVVSCAVLAFFIGNGLRALQIRTFITEDLRQVPSYAGTERRVMFIDPSFAFYGADLVQNDPWLRGKVVRMLSHGVAADADVMRKHFPEFRRVSADIHGTVWSTVMRPTSAPQALVRK